MVEQSVGEFLKTALELDKKGNDAIEEFVQVGTEFIDDYGYSK